MYLIIECSFGDYLYCTCSNQCMYFIGSLPSYFELVPKKPIIVLQGKGGQITCEAEGYTVSKLTWKKRTSFGEVSVPDSMVTNVIDQADNLVKAILTITNARPEDGGDYKCVVTAFNKQDYKLTSIRVDGKFGCFCFICLNWG